LEKFLPNERPRVFLPDRQGISFALARAVKFDNSGSAGAERLPTHGTLNANRQAANEDCHRHLS
jgi:hypothetical protein